MTVCAYNVKVGLSNATFDKGYGSPEVNQISKKKDFSLSCEFPSPIDKGHVCGGIYLFKLLTVKGNKININVA
jgi:hypothetical protein